MSPEEMMREEAHRRMVPRRVKEKCKHGFYTCQACEHDEQVKQAAQERQIVCYDPPCKDKEWCNGNNKCAKHHMSYFSYEAKTEQVVAAPLRDGRAVVTDDAQEIRLTLYDVPLSPRRAIDLAIELLAAAQRHLERAERELRGEPKK